MRPTEHESETIARHLEQMLNQYEALKRKYYQVNEQRAARKQTKISCRLAGSQEQINSLKKEVEKLCAPPNSYSVFRQRNKDGTVDVDLDGRRLKVNVHPKLESFDFEPGQLLALNESLFVDAIKRVARSCV